MQLSNQQIQAIKSLEGHVIPNDICEGPDGAVGHYIETELIKRGIPIDRTGIVDVPFTGDEVKTRNMASNANHTVGTSTIDEIKNKSYKQSNFKKKLTSQIRIEWSNKFNEVAHADIRDLSPSEVQNYFEPTSVFFSLDAQHAFPEAFSLVEQDLVSFLQQEDFSLLQVFVSASFAATVSLLVFLSSCGGVMAVADMIAVANAKLKNNFFIVNILISNYSQK